MENLKETVGQGGDPRPEPEDRREVSTFGAQVQVPAQSVWICVNAFSNYLFFC
jgi:hypothetical protein